MAGSPKYEKTEYQSVNQGGDPIIMHSIYPAVVADTVPSYYSKSYASIIENLFHKKDPSENAPILLKLANVKYIVLRKDVKPNFGPFAGDKWNYSHVYNNLKELDGIKLIKEYKYASLWENKNYMPHIYTAPFSFIIKGDVNPYLSALIHTNYLDYNPILIFTDQLTPEMVANLNNTNFKFLDEEYIWSKVPYYAKPNLLENPSFEAESSGFKNILMHDQAQSLYGSGYLGPKTDSGDLEVMLQSTKKGLPTGDIIASAVIPKTDISINWTWITVNLSYNTLVPNETYAIVLDKTTQTLDLDNCYGWAFRSDLDQYSNGIGYQYNGTNWIKRSNTTDFAFRTYYKKTILNEKTRFKNISMPDQSQSLYGSGYLGPKIDSSSYMLAQTFVPKTTSISSIELFIAIIGNPDGDLKVILQSTKDELPTSDIIASAVIPKTEISTNWTWINVNLSYNNLVQNETYAIVLDKTTQTLDLDNYYGWAFRDDLDHYSNGIGYQYNGTNWIKRSNTTDFAFRTYYDSKMPFGWYYYNESGYSSKVEWTNIDKKEGNYSLKITKNAKGIGGIYSEYVHVSGNTMYTLSLYAKTNTIETNAIQYQIGWLTEDGKWISAADGWTNGTTDWNRYTLTAVSPSNADQAYIRLFVHKNITVYFDAIQLEIGNKATKFWNPPQTVILSNTATQIKENIPANVTHIKINPTKYKIYVDAKEPFWLVFSESFHSGWKAFISDKEIDNHLLVNGYANGWYITKTGKYTITLEFTPQKLFDYGLIFSMIALLGCIGYLNKNRFKKITKKRIY